MKAAKLKRIILKELKVERTNSQHTLTFENEKYIFWWRGQTEIVSEGLINFLLRKGIIIAVKRDYGLCYIPPRDMWLACFKDDLLKRLCKRSKHD